jgi:AraC-like DNA-binding protein
VPLGDDPGIASIIVDGVVRALGELGYEARPHDGSIIPGTIVDALLEDAARSLGDMAIGLSTAQRIPIGSLGDLDYALVTSTTLREGLDRLVRYYSVVTQRVTLALVESDHRAHLVFERVPPHTAHSPHWAEFATAMIAERIRQTAERDLVFEEVNFAHPAPGGPTRHDAFFRTKVRFDAGTDSLGFDRQLLQSPLRTASASLGEVLEARLREVARANAGGVANAFVDKVRRAVLELLDGGKTGLDETAGRLHTSTRTLQRELKQHGTSHQQLLDEVRQGRAKQLLERGESIVDVAAQLGFAEPSAFFRAFRRWTGTSPGAMRAKDRSD